MHETLLGLQFGAERTSGAPATDSAAGERAAPERPEAAREQVATQGAPGLSGGPSGSFSLVNRDAALEPVVTDRDGGNSGPCGGSEQRRDGLGVLPGPRPLTAANPGPGGPDLLSHLPPHIRGRCSSSSRRLLSSGVAAQAPAVTAGNHLGQPEGVATGAAGPTVAPEPGGLRSEATGLVRVKEDEAHRHVAGPVSSDPAVGPPCREVPLGSHPHQPPRDDAPVDDGGEGPRSGLARSAGDRARETHRRGNVSSDEAGAGAPTAAGKDGRRGQRGRHGAPPAPLDASAASNTITAVITSAPPPNAAAPESVPLVAGGSEPAAAVEGPPASAPAVGAAPESPPFLVGGHYLRVSKSAISGAEALQMAFPEAVSAARSTGDRQPVRLQFELAGGGSPVPYDIMLNSYGSRMSLVYTAEALRTLGLRPGDKLWVPPPEPGKPVRAVQVAGASGGAGAAGFSDPPSAVPSPLSPPAAQAGTTATIEPKAEPTFAATGVPETVLEAGPLPPPEHHGRSVSGGPGGTSADGTTQLAAPPEVVAGGADGAAGPGAPGDSGAADQGVTARGRGPRRRGVRVEGHGASADGVGGGAGRGRARAVGGDRATPVAAVIAAAGVSFPAGENGAGDSGAGGVGSGMGAAGGSGGDVVMAASTEGEAGVDAGSGDGVPADIDADTAGGAGEARGRGRIMGRGRGGRRGRGGFRARGGSRSAVSAAADAAIPVNDAAVGDGIAPDAEHPAIATDPAAPVSHAGADDGGGAGGVVRGGRGRGQGGGRSGRASAAAAVPVAVAADASAGGTHAVSAAADGGAASWHASARPTRRRVNKLEVTMADLVRPKAVVVDGLQKGVVDFEWLPPYSSDLGSEHKTRFQQSIKLLKDTFPKNAQQIKQSVRRDCSGGVRNETCMVVGLWVGEQGLGCASLVRVNEDSHGQYHHVEILYHATSEHLRRRSLGRLLVCCILRTVLQAGMEYATVVIGRGEGAKAFWTSLGFRPPIAADGHVAKRVVNCSQEQAPRDEIWLAPLTGGELPVAEVPGVPGPSPAATAAAASGAAAAVAAAPPPQGTEPPGRKRRRLTDGPGAGLGGGGEQGAPGVQQQEVNPQFQSALADANCRVEAAAQLVKLRLEAAPRQFVPLGPAQPSRAAQAVNSARERREKRKAVIAAAAAGCSPVAAEGAAAWLQLLAAMRRRLRRRARAAEKKGRRSAAVPPQELATASGGGGGGGAEFDASDARAGASCYHVRVSHQGSELILGVRTCREAFPRLMAAAITERARQPIRLTARLPDGRIREYDGFLAATSSNNYYFNGVGGMLRDMGTRSGWVSMWVRPDGGVLVEAADAATVAPPPKGPAAGSAAAGGGGGAPAAGGAAAAAAAAVAASRPGFHAVLLRSSSLLGTTITVPQAVVRGVLGVSEPATTASDSDQQQQPLPQPPPQPEVLDTEEDLAVPVRVHFWRGIYRASDAVLQRIGAAGSSSASWKLCGLQPWLRYRGAAPGDVLLIGAAPAAPSRAAAASGDGGSSAGAVEILVELSKGTPGKSGPKPVAPEMGMAAASAAAGGGGGAAASTAATTTNSAVAFPGFARKRKRSDRQEVAVAPSPAARARYFVPPPEVKLEVEEEGEELGFQGGPQAPPNLFGPKCGFVLHNSHFTNAHITYIPVHVMADLFAPLAQPQSAAGGAAEPPAHMGGLQPQQPLPYKPAGPQQVESGQQQRPVQEGDGAEKGRWWPPLSRLPKTIQVWSETSPGELTQSRANFHYYASCGAWRVRRLVPWLLAEGAQPGSELTLRLATWAGDAAAGSEPGAGRLAIIASVGPPTADQDTGPADDEMAADEPGASSRRASSTFARLTPGAAGRGRGRGRGRWGPAYAPGGVGGGGRGGRGRGRGRGGFGGDGELRLAGSKRKAPEEEDGEEERDGEYHQLAPGPLPAGVLLAAVRAELPLPPPLLPASPPPVVPPLQVLPRADWGAAGVAFSGSVPESLLANAVAPVSAAEHSPMPLAAEHSQSTEKALAAQPAPTAEPPPSTEQAAAAIGACPATAAGAAAVSSPPPTGGAGPLTAADSARGAGNMQATESGAVAELTTAAAAEAGAAEPSGPAAAAAATPSPAKSRPGMPGVVGGSLGRLAEVVTELLRPKAADEEQQQVVPAVMDERLRQAVGRLDCLGGAAVVAAHAWVAGGQLPEADIDGALLRVVCAPLPGLKLRLALRQRSSRSVGSDATPDQPLTWADVSATALFGELLDSLAAADEVQLQQMAAWLRGLAEESVSESEGPGVTLQLEPQRTHGAVGAAAAEATAAVQSVATVPPPESGPLAMEVVGDAAAVGDAATAAAQAPRLRVQLASVAQEWQLLSTRPLAHSPPRSSIPLLLLLPPAPAQGGGQHQEELDRAQSQPQAQAEAQREHPAGLAPRLPPHALALPADANDANGDNPAVLGSSLLGVRLPSPAPRPKGHPRDVGAVQTEPAGLGTGDGEEEEREPKRSRLA